MRRKEPATAAPTPTSPTGVVEFIARRCTVALDRHLPDGCTLALDTWRAVERRYLDTHDWRLWAAGATLVAETTGGTTSLTWRPPHAGAVTAPCAATPRFADELPEGTVGREVSALVGERALLPVAELRLDQRRGAVRDRHGKIVARLRWERGVPLDEHGQPSGSPLVTLRVEGVRGYDGLVRTLIASLAGIAGIGVAVDSELARAASVRHRAPGDYSSRLDIRLSPEMPAAQATRIILRRLLEMACTNIAGTVEDVDAEFLHDLRVAVRRARSALGQLAGAYDEARYARLRTELRWLGEVTGACRDFDVFLSDLRKYQSELGSPTGTELAPLLADLTRRRADHFAALRSALTSARLRHLLATWRRVTEPPRRPPHASEAAWTACELGGARVQRAWRRMRRHARRLPPHAPPEGLHRLRIDAKKLRYLLEFFSSLWGRRGAELIHHLKGLQDALGTFNDLAVQRQRLAEGLHDLLARGEITVPTALAAGRLEALLAARQDAQRLAIADRLQAFFSREIATQVAAVGSGKEV